jgi:hypothetical protein
LFSDRGRLARQHQETGLEDILGILDMLEQPPAQTQDHRPMPPNQRRKSRFVSPANESFQQLLIRNKAPPAPLCQVANLLNHSVHRGPGHEMAYS